MQPTSGCLAGGQRGSGGSLWWALRAAGEPREALALCKVTHLEQQPAGVWGARRGMEGFSPVAGWPSGT